MSVIQSKIDEFKKLYPDHELVVVIQTGSHLFKLNTENSDLDLTGIFIPSFRDVKKNKKTYRHDSLVKEINLSTNKSKKKNSKEDIDFKLTSIFRFFELLSMGEFNSIEWLFAPSYSIVYSSKHWDSIQEARDNLVVFNLSSFLGFIKREYNSTGISGSSYHELSEFYNLLKDKKEKILKDVWDDVLSLPFAKPTESLVNTKEKGKGIPSVIIGFRVYQNTVRLNHLREELLEFLNKHNPSHRKNSSGIDVKGLYHCQRLIFEAYDLIEKNQLEIPFSTERTQYLMDIRKGIVPFEEINTNITNSIEELKSLEHTLPSNTNSLNLLDSMKNNLFSFLEIKDKTNKKR